MGNSISHLIDFVSTCIKFTWTVLDYIRFLYLSIFLEYVWITLNMFAHFSISAKQKRCATKFGIYPSKIDVVNSVLSLFCVWKNKINCVDADAPHRCSRWQSWCYLQSHVHRATAQISALMRSWSTKLRELLVRLGKIDFQQARTVKGCVESQTTDITQLVPGWTLAENLK